MTPRTRKASRATAAPEPEPAIAEVTSEAEAPIPEAIMAQWFPANLVLPGETAPRRKGKVYATDKGLYVYFSVPEGQSVQPDWWSPLLEGQNKPPTGYAARMGIVLRTEAGIVRLTKDNACGCGWPLKRWTPEYATHIRVWS